MELKTEQSSAIHSYLLSIKYLTSNMRRHAPVNFENLSVAVIYRFLACVEIDLPSSNNLSLADVLSL